MLDPQPGRTDKGTRTRRPIRVINKSTLKSAWLRHRDSRANAGRAGFDNVSAQAFAANLEPNLEMIAKLIRNHRFGFDPLKPAFIPKGDKWRMICIPTVRDRLVQRVIADYLAAKQNTPQQLPIYSPFSFGFIPERGTKSAIEKAIELRNQYDWCLKTDIESFFDSIPREYLKDRIRTAMRRHSLTDILCKVVECDIRKKEYQTERLAQQGLKRGCGLRQGMPLSPLLSNLALSKFDAAIRKKRLVMVRYADDLMLFFKSEAEMLAGEEFVRSELGKLELSIPLDGKTQKIKPKGSVEFLGRELFHSEIYGYRARVSEKQIKKILQRIREDYSLQKRISKKSNFQETVLELGRSASSYLGIYKDASNFPHFEVELRTEYRKVLRRLFLDIFGNDSLNKVSKESLLFLGIEDLKIPSPINDLDV